MLLCHQSFVTYSREENRQECDKMTGNLISRFVYFPIVFSFFLDRHFLSKITVIITRFFVKLNYKKKLGI